VLHLGDVSAQVGGLAAVDAADEHHAGDDFSGQAKGFSEPEREEWHHPVAHGELNACPPKAPTQSWNKEIISLLWGKKQVATAAKRPFLLSGSPCCVSTSFLLRGGGAKKKVEAGARLQLFWYSFNEDQLKGRRRHPFERAHRCLLGF
jgi:hypothetical protein